MTENFRVKVFRDAGDLYNHLSYKGILKGSNRDSISGEEGYTSEFYNKWKDSVYARMLQGEITLRLLGEYRAHQDSVMLLKATREDGRQGIIDIELNTIIPLKYCAIKIIELCNNVLFITDKFDGERVLHSLYCYSNMTVQRLANIESGVR